MALFLAAILLSKVTYQLVETFMWMAALLTLVGLFGPAPMARFCTLCRGSQKRCLALFVAELSMPRPGDPSDATKLLTAITFAGFGGFWTLFYSYWMRDKGAGMAYYMGRLTGPITGKAEAMPASGFLPGNDEGLAHVRRWRRYLFWDVSIGIGGNLLTTRMTCLLAYALLSPKGLLPQGFELALVQSRFFEVSWGVFGRILILIVAAAFLSDTWLATVDAASRIHTDCLYAFFPRSQSTSVRGWYLIFLFLLTGITAATMGFAEPGPLILLSAVIGFVGTVPTALMLLNHVYLPRHLPSAARPGWCNLIFICISCLADVLLTIAYLLTVTRMVKW